MPRLPLALALLLLLPFANADAATAPAFVLAADADAAHALVAWAPGASPADAYRVYGVSPEGAFTLLAEAPSIAADGYARLVAGGYATYAVSGVVDGRESHPTLAGGGGACVTYEEIPWGITVTTECLPDITDRMAGVVRA